MGTDKKRTPRSRRDPRMNGPLVMLAIVVLVGVGFLAARSYFGSLPVAGSGTDTNTSASNGTSNDTGQAGIGGPFTLVDQDGRTVTDQDFRGHWLLLYFGYTYCPDVCPTSLSRNAEALDLLGPKGDDVTPALVTIDPQRDTSEKLKDYVHFFHPRMVGLTGTPEQIAAVAKAYRVYYAKVERGEGEAYLMDHSSFTYLINPEGKFVQVFRHDMSAQDMADAMKKVL